MNNLADLIDDLVTITDEEPTLSAGSKEEAPSHYQNTSLREQINADVEQFLSNSGIITSLPEGEGRYKAKSFSFVKKENNPWGERYED